MTVGIEQLFRSMAGADWMSEGGGLSASEFSAALKDRANLALGKVEQGRTAAPLGCRQIKITIKIGKLDEFRQREAGLLDSAQEFHGRTP